MLQKAGSIDSHAWDLTPPGEDLCRTSQEVASSDLLDMEVVRVKPLMCMKAKLLSLTSVNK